MKKTTVVLAFCATLLVSSTAAALVVIEQPARKPAKRKGETDVSTRVFTPEVKTGKRVVDAPAVKVAMPAAENTEVVAPKAQPSVTSELPSKPEVEAEREPEVITEYYASGAVRAIYRGYRVKNAEGEIAISKSSTARVVIGKRAVEANDSNVVIESGEIAIDEEKLVRLREYINIQDCNTYNIGLIALEAHTRHGLYESYFENGQLDCRGEFERNVLKGYWSYYHTNGQLREAGEFKDGQRQGHWTSYHENGLRASESHWDKGVEQGIHTDWHASGLIAAQGNMKEGQRDGWWICYSEDGAKLREGNCENGAETGDWREYQPILRKQICQQEINDNCQDLEVQEQVQIKTIVHTR